MPTSRCRRCNSAKVISNIRVMDQGHSSDGKLSLVVHADPSAFVMKGTIHGQLVCSLCCDCGDVVFHCKGNLTEIWAAYSKAGGKTIEDVSG